MEARVLQLPIFCEEREERDLSGAELAASLPEDFEGLSDDEVLEAAAAARRVASWAQARELDAIAELHRRRTRAEQDGDPDYRILNAHESVCQEVSAALSITGTAAATLVDRADQLTTRLPDTWQAFQTGHIDSSKARVFCELTHGLEPELCQFIEANVLPTAGRRTTGQLRRRIRDLLRKLAPESLRQRKREAVHDRRLEVWDDEYSGTSNLVMSGLEPVRTHALFNRITAAARGAKADGDPRTLHQLRADLACQLLQGHDLPDAVRTVLAQTPGDGLDQPAATASGTVPAAPSGAEVASDAIAALIADMADRELGQVRDHLKASGRTRALPFRITRAAQDLHDRLSGLRETWCRTHDPDYGRATYRPSGGLRRVVEARHVTCVFPSCNQRSTRCDLDHTIPWGRGTSCQCNLAPLCRKHHRTKQTPGWKLLQPWPGLLIWITPSGSWHMVLPTRE